MLPETFHKEITGAWQWENETIHSAVYVSGFSIRRSGTKGVALDHSILSYDFIESVYSYKLCKAFLRLWKTNELVWIWIYRSNIRKINSLVYWFPTHMPTIILLKSIWRAGSCTKLYRNHTCDVAAERGYYCINVQDITRFWLHKLRSWSLINRAKPCTEQCANKNVVSIVSLHNRFRVDEFLTDLRYKS